MIDDLKNYRAERDAFDLGFSGDQLVGALCVILAIGAVFADYL